MKVRCKYELRQAGNIKIVRMSAYSKKVNVVGICHEAGALYFSGSESQLKKNASNPAYFNEFLEEHHFHKGLTPKQKTPILMPIDEMRLPSNRRYYLDCLLKNRPEMEPEHWLDIDDELSAVQKIRYFPVWFLRKAIDQGRVGAARLEKMVRLEEEYGELQRSGLDWAPGRGRYWMR